MNAIKLLRTMHAESKVQFKLILGSDEATAAGQRWQQLQPVLELHEQLEDTFLYTPLHGQFPPGTPLGDWEPRHEADVELVEQLVAQSRELQPGTPAWLMCVARIQDTLSRHILEEEGRIFPRIEQLLGSRRLADIGQQMQTAMDKSVPRQAPKAKTEKTRVTAKPAATRHSR